VKVSYVALLAVFFMIVAGGGRAEAFFGYGYRANEVVQVDRCYRGLAWNYAVPYYMVGPKQRHYHRVKCRKR
jgi:hypothetical protein